MKKNELHLRVISPSETKFDGNVSMVVLPGVEGDFGVLAYHMTLIAALKKGKIKIHQNGVLISEIKIESGVATVSDKGLDVLI